MEFLTYGRNITLDEARSLQQLIFGNTELVFGIAWTNQSFKFRGDPVPYGLIQNRTGPCGVIAAVQAHVIYELLFGYSRSTLIHKRLRPSCKDKQEALARAIGSILWQAGENERAIVAMKNNDFTIDRTYDNGLREEGVIEYLKLFTFSSKENLLSFLFNNITLLMVNSSGSCVTLLYSVCLSRGIEKIKEDLDYQETPLMESDGFCSQEIVNLMLVGRASNNVFDGDIEVNFGGEETTTLRGILEQSRIGFLSEYDSPESFLKIGTFYRYPSYPIWVIFGQYHYTVLFSPSREIFNMTKKKESFPLYHVDSLSIGNRETCFVLTPVRDSPPAKSEKNASYIVKCIRKRWPMAQLKPAKN